MDLFFLIISHGGLKAVPLLPQLHRWEPPLYIFLEELSIFWLIPPVISGLPDFPDRSYFFSFQPSQNMRPKELRASVQDFQRPHRLASMPTICACTVGTSDALGMCGTHCIGNMEHICTYFHPKSYIIYPRYFPLFYSCMRSNGIVETLSICYKFIPSDSPNIFL